MTGLAIALALVVGVLLGMLGGGGSILMVPLLTYVAGLEPHAAIASSLFAVGIASLVSVGPHARRGTVRWRTGGLFAAGGVVGAVLGGALGSLLPGPVLMIGFAAMMLLTARGMIRGRRGGTSLRREHRLRVGQLLATGLGVGLITGLVGAGGGFLIVPALVLLAGLPMSAAVGTSLMVIALQTLAGFAGRLPSVSVDWGLLLALTVMAVMGAVIGVILGKRVPDRVLRLGFGWFVLVMGLGVLAAEVVGLLG